MVEKVEQTDPKKVNNTKHLVVEKLSSSVNNPSTAVQAKKTPKEILKKIERSACVDEKSNVKNQKKEQ